MSADQERHLFRVFRQEFIIDKRFQIIKELGHGAYGLVVSAKYIELPNGGSVAIKKITNIFSKKVLCKRAIREIKLLKHFTGHKNITALYDLDIVDPNSFNEVYLYEELMECDLHQIIKSGQPLTDAHYQSFVYQILCGLKYIHSADVLHRDLKPGNLLVNADCELKICDFGLARGFSTDAEKNAGYLTEYVATRWYRAPEIMLSFHSYSKAIDIWSVGCILAELLGGKPFFKGKDYVDQLNQILRIIGTPNEETLVRIGSKRAQSYVRSLPFMPKVPFSHLFPDANIEGLDLLEKMLALDPSQRVDVDQALTHPYLKVWHDPAEEIVCAEKFDFSFESLDDFDSMKQLLVNEVKLFREFVRKPQLTPEEIQQQELQQQQDLLQHQHQQQQQQILQQQQQQQQQQSILSPTQFAANGTSTNQYYDDPPKPQENIYYTNQYSVQNDGNNGLNHQISQNIHNGYSHDGLYQHQGLNGSKGDLLTGLEQELEFGLDGQGFYKS